MADQRDLHEVEVTFVQEFYNSPGIVAIGDEGVSVLRNLQLGKPILDVERSNGCGSGSLKEFNSRNTNLLVDPFCQNQEPIVHP